MDRKERERKVEGKEHQEMSKNLKKNSYPLGCEIHTVSVPGTEGGLGKKTQ